MGAKRRRGQAAGSKAGSAASAHRVAKPARRRPAWALVAGALVVAAAWAYSTSFRGVFVYDDHPAIVENPHIKSLWPPSEAMRAPAEAPVSGRPVASLTLALNYALAPADARDVMAPSGPGLPPGAADRFYRNIWGYHAVNVIVHVLAALALFGVIRRTLVAPPLTQRYGQAAGWIAGTSAVIWLVHPLNTQAVTYVVRRVESLAGLFFLLTLYCAIRAAEGGARRRWWVSGAIAACALGMGTKEVMVGAPLVVWLWDVIFGTDRRGRRSLYIGLAATWLVLAALVWSELRPQSVGFGLGWTWWEYLVTQAGVIVHYLRLSIVPWPLVFDYGWPKATSLTDVLPQALLVAGLAAATAVALVRRHPAGLVGAWFFIILAPTSSVLPVVTEVAAEHRMYLPLAAVVLAVVLGVYEAGRVLRRRGTGAGRVSVVTAIVALAALSITFAEMTRERNRDYWSDEGLWLDTIQKRPANPQARIGYAINLLAAQRWAEAERELRVAIALEPRNGRAHMNLGSSLAAQGRVAEGIRHLELARDLAPHIHETWGLLAQAYQDQRRIPEAVAMYRRAVAVMPDNPFLLNSFAWVLATSAENGVRDGHAAVQHAERALQVAGGRPPIFLTTLAAAQAEAGSLPAAVATAREALSRAAAEGDQALAADLRWQLASYEAGRPLRIR